MRIANVIRVAAMAAAVLLSACERGARAPERVGDSGVAPAGTDEDALALFLTRTVGDFGSSRAELTARFGEPDSVATGTVSNRHDPTVTDSVFTLYFPGLTADVYRASYDGKEILTGARIYDEAHLRDASRLRPGSSAAEVRAALGEPADASGGDLQYVCDHCLASGHETVRFVIAGGRVHAFHIQYWLD